MEKKVKVCLLQPYLTPYRQGLFNALSDRLLGGLAVMYFAREEEARKWSFQRTVRFHEIFLKTKVTRLGYDSTRVQLSFLSLAKELIRLGPQVVIASEGTPGRMVRLLQTLLRFKVIFWTESTEIALQNRRPNPRAVSWVDRGVSAYVVPGVLSRQYLQNVRGYNGPIYFSPNTIDRERFSCSAQSVKARFSGEEPLRILFSGSLIPRKGIKALQDALGKIAESGSLPPYRVDVIGEGPEEKKPIENVFYHGFVGQEETVRFVKQAHILVLPSLWDCNPLVVTEAVTAGCVTVLSDGVGNHPEYTDGNGVVFERGNADALFGALQNVMSRNRDELLKMALRSLEISATVSHENSAEVFLQAVTDAMTTIKRKK